MVAAHNIQQSNTRRGGRGGNGLAFVERRVVASTSAMPEPMFRTDAYDEGAAIHRRERHHPSHRGKIGGRARLGWLWEACRGGECYNSVFVLSQRVDDAPRL